MVPSKKYFKNENFGVCGKPIGSDSSKGKRKKKSDAIDDNNNDININSSYSNFIHIVFLKVMFGFVETSCFLISSRTLYSKVGRIKGKVRNSC